MFLRVEAVTTGKTHRPRLAITGGQGITHTDCQPFGLGSFNSKRGRPRIFFNHLPPGKIGQDLSPDCRAAVRSEIITVWVIIFFIIQQRYQPDTVLVRVPFIPMGRGKDSFFGGVAKYEGFAPVSDGSIAAAGRGVFPVTEFTFRGIRPPVLIVRKGGRRVCNPYCYCPIFSPGVLTPD